MKIGIYKITSKIKPNYFYIGSAVHIQQRWNKHLSQLNNGKHGNNFLQNHYNKYGIEDLVFSIILECEVKDLIKNEQYFIDTLNPTFNICTTAGSRLGSKASPETIEKKRLSMIGKTHTDEAKLKMRLAKTGKKRKPFSDETKEKMKGNTNAKGLKHSDKSKELMRLSRIGMKYTKKINYEII